MAYSCNNTSNIPLSEHQSQSKQQLHYSNEYVSPETSNQPCFWYSSSSSTPIKTPSEQPSPLTSPNQLTLSQCFNASTSFNSSNLPEENYVLSGVSNNFGQQNQSEAPKRPPSRLILNSESSKFQNELSELGISLAKLALHAEGAPLIICDDYVSAGGKSSKNLPQNNCSGGRDSNQPLQRRRRSYRILHPPPLPLPPYYYHHLEQIEPNRSNIQNSSNLAVTASSYRNLSYFYSTAGNGAYGNYFDANSSSMLATTSNSNNETKNGTLPQLLSSNSCTVTTSSMTITDKNLTSSTSSSSYFFHHHHHYHYHHHLHSTQQQQQSRIVNNTNEQENYLNQITNENENYQTALLDNTNPQGSFGTPVPFVKEDDLFIYNNNSNCIHHNIINGQKPFLLENFHYEHENNADHHKQSDESHETVILQCNDSSLNLTPLPTQELSIKNDSTSTTVVDTLSSNLDQTDSILECLTSSLELDHIGHQSSTSFGSTSSTSASCSPSSTSSFCQEDNLSNDSALILSKSVNIANGHFGLNHQPLVARCSDSLSTTSSASSLSSSTSSESTSDSGGGNGCTSSTSIDGQLPKRLSVPKILKPRKRRRKTTSTMLMESNSCLSTNNINDNNSLPSLLLFDLDDYCFSSNRIFNKELLSHSKYMPEHQPPTRPWLTLAEPTPSHHVSNIFTVMCYNVLCEKLASRQLYSYCPSWALSWDFRKTVIMKEIKQYDADIICLQEVESGQYETFFLTELQKSNYVGIFSPKSRAKTMNEQERKRVDGCAIFYKHEKFELVHNHLMEFTFLAAQTADGEGSEEMLNRVMPKDNIGLVALLKTKEVEIDIQHKAEFKNMQPFESQPLFVCTAHIHWDPEYCDVKLIQTMLMMRELQKFIDQSSAMFNLFNSNNSTVDPNSVPLIICGDFNSLPDSGVVEYLTKGRISVEHADFKKLAYKLCLRKICPVVDQNDKEYSHPFDITKAYDDGVLPFTNYTFDFRGVIDYIFCSRRLFSVLGVLGPFDTNWFTKHRIPGCPHHYIPSDHFPIVAELELLTKQSLVDLEKKKQEKNNTVTPEVGNTNANNSNKTGNTSNSANNSSNGHMRR